MIRVFFQPRFFCLALCLICSIALADDESKRQLEHSDYDRWNTISMQSISNDGQWIMYSIESGKIDGDQTLVIRKNGGTKQYSILRGQAARFTFDSKFAAYEIAPDPQLVKKLKKEKAKPEVMPVKELQLLELANGTEVTVPRIKSFSFPEKNGNWLAYLLEKPLEKETVKEQKSETVETYEVTSEGLQRPQKPLKLKPRRSEEPAAAEEKQSEPEKETKQKEKEQQTPTTETTKADDEKPEKKEKSQGTVLVVRDLRTGVERRFPDVSQFLFSKFGDSLAFSTSLEQEKDDTKGNADKPDETAKERPDDNSEPTTSPMDGVYILDLDKQTVSEIASGLGNYKHFAFNDKGTELAFVSDKDDYDSKTSGWSLYYWKRGQQSAKLIAAEKTAGIPDNWWVSSDSSSYFSEDGRRLFFETAPVPETVEKERAEAQAKKDGKPVEDDEDDDDKPKLDIWHWQDPLLQPQQLLQAEQERKRNYVAVYDLRTGKIVQLADKNFPSVSIDRRSTADIAVGVTNMPYRKMLSWDVPGFQDSYLVDLKTGDRTRILEKSKARAQLSPEAKYVTWYDAEAQKWFAASTGTDTTPIEISQGIEFPLYDELHDTPSLPEAYGNAGWLKDDGAFLIYDRYDIWQLDPTGKTPPVCITEGLGRKNNIRFRYDELDDEARAIDPTKDMMLSAFDETTKASGFYQLKPHKEKKTADNDHQQPTESRLQPLIMLDESLGRLTKAKDTLDVMFTRSTFIRCPDIWTSTTEFKKISRISDINPQQDDYLWGTVELVSWKATDGQELQGLLYKPENFEADKKYPLMVYFYERNSDNLHRYYPPAAGRSIINFSFYVSRGYVLFVPDIPYTTGEPGPSAANAVIPGTQSIVDMGFIDQDRIGMQGHSWGGYQTAFLVTQTDLFACAESGAPVSNMTSAYGGIRWGSGMSRMFQYERTQSRIGDTLWAARDKYIANSPLFAADKIHTPLLILHNDEDGAVPWYQGIELFVALRRLEKPAWLLNYNGNPHWVMGQPNRRDFAKRMQQFFDHYLQGSPEPEWMAYGVSAVEKGENLGLDLLEPAKEEASEKAKEPQAETAGTK